MFMFWKKRNIEYQLFQAYRKSIDNLIDISIEQYKLGVYLSSLKTIEEAQANLKALETRIRAKKEEYYASTKPPRIG